MTFSRARFLSLVRTAYHGAHSESVARIMLQRLLDTVSLTGGQWVVVIALSLVAPILIGIDKAVQLHRTRQTTTLGMTSTPGT